MDFTTDEDYADFMAMLNETESTSDYPSYVVREIVRFCSMTNVNKFGATFIPYFYYINFLLSYVGNGLVLFIIYKFEKLNSVTNIFLLNLVASNLLFASSFPFRASYHASEWTFGKALCKMVSSAYQIGFYSSILFLTLMTFDRYLAVVHAVTAAKSRKKAYAISASVVVWFISVVASLNELVLKDVWKHPVNGLMCEVTGFSEEVIKQWNLVSIYMQFLLFFLLPLFMVIYCYTCITIRIMSTRMKEKCRSIKLIFIIMFTFFACWTPFNIVILLQALNISSANNMSCAHTEQLNYAFYVTRNLAFLYCCISPIFYTFVGKKFQSHFRKLLSKRIPCLSRYISLSSQSSRSNSHKTSHTTCDRYDY